MECVVHSLPTAEDALVGLGLTPGLLESVLRGAEAEARTHTALDPPIMAGLSRWARTNRLLREFLVPKGWSYDNPRNLARTISPGREIAIIATLGDALTGDPSPRAQPSTMYAKGIATIDAIDGNVDQLALFELPPSTTGRGEPKATWILLYHVTPSQIRAELSLPASITAGRIDGWRERIVLAPIPLEEPVRMVSPTGHLDVFVEARR